VHPAAKAKAIAHWVERGFGVCQTESGMTGVLQPLGYAEERCLSWIKGREEPQVRSNTDRKRLSINGAIDVERLEPVARLD
jgi:hypothetical protein